MQSDIYSLGATLQTLLTGKDLSEPIFGYASPYAQDQEVPAELELLLLQMLDADVGQRPASMETVKLALQDRCQMSAFQRGSGKRHTGRCLLLLP